MGASREPRLELRACRIAPPTPTPAAGRRCWPPALRTAWSGSFVLAPATTANLYTDPALRPVTTPPLPANPKKAWPPSPQTRCLRAGLGRTLLPGLTKSLKAAATAEGRSNERLKERQAKMAKKEWARASFPVTAER